MSSDRPRHGRYIAVHNLNEALRGHAFAHRSKPLHVAEHHGHDATLAVDRRHFGTVDQPLYDFRIDVPTECFADAFVSAQVLNHSVECSRKLTNLVSGGDADQLIETAGFHLSRAVQQSPHRTGDATTNKKREA